MTASTISYRSVVTVAPVAAAVAACRRAREIPRSRASRLVFTAAERTA
jgi:hypothetical protein